MPFVIIGPSSPLSYRTAVRLLAENFANYTGFSPAPYEAEEADYELSYARDRVLLFSRKIDEQSIRCFGAAGIRRKKYDEIPTPGWFMTWAWFHPSEQRKGHLTKAWPHILKLFPDIIPDPPLSDEMKSFLIKIGTKFPPGVAELLGVHP